MATPLCWVLEAGDAEESGSEHANSGSRSNSHDLHHRLQRPNKKIFAWNQWKNGKIVNSMPKGSYEVHESDLPIEFKDLIFVKCVRFDPPESDRKQIEDIL